MMECSGDCGVTLRFVRDKLGEIEEDIERVLGEMDGRLNVVVVSSRLKGIQGLVKGLRLFVEGETDAVYK